MESVCKGPFVDNLNNQTSSALETSLLPAVSIGLRQKAKRQGERPPRAKRQWNTEEHQKGACIHRMADKRVRSTRDDPLLIPQFDGRGRECIFPKNKENEKET